MLHSLKLTATKTLRINILKMRCSFSAVPIQKGAFLYSCWLNVICLFCTMVNRNFAPPFGEYVFFWFLSNHQTFANPSLWVSGSVQFVSKNVRPVKVDQFILQLEWGWSWKHVGKRTVGKRLFRNYRNLPRLNLFRHHHLRMWSILITVYCQFYTCTFWFLINYICIYIVHIWFAMFCFNKLVGMNKASGQIITTKPPVGHLKLWFK